MSEEHEGPGDAWLADYQFGLELDGVLTAYFESASGIGEAVIEVEPVLGHADPTLAPPFQKGWRAEITLRRGVANSTEIASWYRQVEASRHREAHRDGSIILFGPTGMEHARWNFTDGWPSSYTVSARSSTSVETAIEELVIVFTAMTRAV